MKFLVSFKFSYNFWKTLRVIKLYYTRSIMRYALVQFIFHSLIYLQSEVGKNLGLSTAKPNSKPRLQTGLKPKDLILNELKPFA